jgi:nitronate monooxygenase
MDFGSGGNTDAKAWKDIWGAGQGVGSIKARISVAELIDTLKIQFDEARDDLRDRCFAEELLVKAT